MSGVQTNASATAELVLEPQVRKFSDRRWLLAVLAIPVLGLAAYAAVVRLSSLEQMLVTDAAQASRAVLYELPRKSALAAPIEPGTEIIRVTMHAYVRDADLPLGKRAAKIHVAMDGAHGHRTEDLSIDLPGQRTRVTSDEPDLAIGDPVGVDFDVHDLGAGELTLTLLDIDKADGVMVRMYRRESISLARASTRDSVLDQQRKNHLARWTWELAWDEASVPEQEEILADRWRRVGALHGSGHDLRSIAVALVPRPAVARPPGVDDSLGATTLRGDERIAFIVHDKRTLRVSSDLGATLSAVIRDLRGGVRTAEAVGELVVSTSGEGDESVELAADRDVLVNVRTPDPHSVEWLGYSQGWRTTALSPLVVESPDADRLLRVSVRRPVDRGETAPVPVEAAVELTGPDKRTIARKVMKAMRARSRYDRYEAFDPTEAPTERFTFYVGVPKGGAVEVASSTAEPLDVAIAELDPSAPFEPLRGRRLDEPLVDLALEGVSQWVGFVARRPSNANRFDAAHRPLVRVGRRIVTLDPPPAQPPVARFTLSGVTKEVDGKTFVKVGPSFHGEVGTERPLLVPFRLIGDPGTDVDVRIRPSSADNPGIFARITLPRTVTIGQGPTRATLTVGDDTPPGPVTLEVTVHTVAGAPSPGPTWIHLPRAVRHGSSAPRWIAGEFEE